MAVTDLRVPTFRDAVTFWTKLGFVNFGGPAAQIALMHREVVDRRRWVSASQFTQALGFCMLLPGPEAQQLSIYLGWLLHGIPGGLVAGVAFISPAIILMGVLSWLAVVHASLPVVSGALLGLAGVVVGIVLDSVIRLAWRFRQSPSLGALGAGVLLARLFLDLSFPLVILGTGCIGMLLWRNKLTAVVENVGPLLPDQGSRQEPKVFAGRTGILTSTFGLLWAVPIVTLWSWRGSDDILFRLAMFFSETAWFTFGGAYAVLSHVADVAVNSYHWIGSERMAQGLGLAETTPGPLIMVTQYVGFIAAYSQPSDMSPVVTGILGGFVTTYFTFLPCFFMVFLGAPYVERLTTNPWIAGALRGVSAAVFGVIAHFALTMTIHLVMAPDQTPNWFGIAVATCAFTLLRTTSVPTTVVVPIGATMGVLWAYFT